MREIKLKKEKRPKYDPVENQKSQKFSRDIPLGGPTTVTDTTSYSRAQSMIPKQPTPKPNVPKAIQAQQEQEAREKLEKARRDLEKNPKSPLELKSESSGRL